MAALKLVYFDFPGKAAGLRLAAAYGGLEFEDFRFKERAELTAMKESGELPYGQVPALFVDGQILGQSSAIMRYIGKATGLYPEDPVKAALVDSIMDSEADMTAGISCARYQDRFGFESLGGFRDAERTQMAPGTHTVMESIASNVLPRHLSQLERVLADGGTDWMAGTDKPTICDFTLVPRLIWLASGSVAGVPTTCLDAFPKLCNLIAKLSALPEVVAWNEKVSAAGSPPDCPPPAA